MGVRPPADDGEEPAAIEFGIAAVDARLDEADVSFPATRADLLEELDGDVPYDGRGRTMRFADALERTDRREFDAERELLDALHPVFEERRGSPMSLLDRVKALFSF
jgi:hypothetical protein